MCDPEAEAEYSPWLQGQGGLAGQVHLGRGCGAETTVGWQEAPGTSVVCQVLSGLAGSGTERGGRLSGFS